MGLKDVLEIFFKNNKGSFYVIIGQRQEKSSVLINESRDTEKCVENAYNFIVENIGEPTRIHYFSETGILEFCVNSVDSHEYMLMTYDAISGRI